MNKNIYSKMALQNIKKNSKMYLPYIFTFVGMASMYYIITSLSLNPTLKNLKKGSSSTPRMLEFGVWVVAIFAVIFLFYTNSFLIKRRKKELGLYNILGMEKRHISRVLMWENIFVLTVGLFFGLALGILFDKLVFMILIKVLGETVPLTFYFSSRAFINTVILFTVISVLIHLNSMRQVHFSKPIELLKGGSVGEREPKTKLIMTLLGILSLGAGYYISVTTKNPIEAFNNLFIAIVLVIIGTYLLFTAGSIAMLKLLRKNKKYYYKPNHFISISGMMYRMKQNAVGLANICILCSAVVITISTTVALRVGVEESVRSTYPCDVMLSLTQSLYDENNKPVNAKDMLHSTSDRIMKKHGLEMGEKYEFSISNFLATRQGDTFSCSDDGTEKTFTCFFIMTLDEYNKCTGKNEVLSENEVLCYDEINYNSKQFKIFDQTYLISKKIDTLPSYIYFNCAAYENYIFLVVNNQKTADTLLESITQSPFGSEIVDYYYFNINGGEKEERAGISNEIGAEIKKLASESEHSFGYSYDGYDVSLNNAVDSYSGLLFVGIFLGIIFLMATVLIIYYKQITEGHEDFSRYDIMRKVGITHKEIKSSINSQVMTVFFLPLIVAVVHMCFAFPVMNKILDLVGGDNSSLYLICMAVSMAIFAVIYVIIYIVTSRVYYGIVTQKNDY